MAKLQTASKFFGMTVAKSLPAAQLTGTVSVFEIRNGPLYVMALGLLVTTVLPAGANTAKFTHTAPGGSAIDLCAVTDLASGAVGQIYSVNGTKATALVKATDVSVLAAGQALSMPILLSHGIVKIVFSAGPPATGFTQAFMVYQPAGSFTEVVVS